MSDKIRPDAKIVFTDEDLKRLKVEGLRFGDISSDDFRSILARLAAAEGVCDAVRHSLDLTKPLSGTEQWNLTVNSFRKWLSACGKGE